MFSEKIILKKKKKTVLNIHRYEKPFWHNLEKGP